MDKDKLWFKFILNNDGIKDEFITKFKIYCNAVPLSEINEIFIPTKGLISLVKYMSIHSENEEVFQPLVDEFNGVLIKDEPTEIISLNLFSTIKLTYNGEDSAIFH
jgi:hypothetical protein